MANTKLPARLLDTSAVPALNVTGDLTVDTTTLKVDSSNNRVGIGITSSIDSNLHVADGTAQINIEGTSGDATLKLESTGNSYWNMFIDESDARKLKFEDNGYGVALTIQRDGVITYSTGPSAGAVGTYALLWRVDSGTGNSFGDTLAGSNLRAANTYHNGQYSNFGYGSTSVSGTWRCMGNTGIYNGSTAYSSNIWIGCTIWVRIS